MTKRSAIRVILGATVVLAALTTSVSPAFAWTGSAGHIGIVQSWNGHTEILDVEGSDDIETVRRSLFDKTGIDPADTCLLFEGTLMQDERTLIDYGVEPNDNLSLFLLPVTAAWSITPDDHIVGNTVHNVPVTSPAGTHFAVVDGALPAGVTLDENTGIVDGKFASPDPFDVTIRVTTLCGDADITWSSSGGQGLADTGLDTGSRIAAGVGALAAAGIGAVLVLRRRATGTER
jgi:LPXTG-motif cell wall-anchored protein